MAGSTASPQSKLPLSMLSHKTGHLGTWEVCIACPVLNNGEYKTTSGVMRSCISFECVLVSVQVPRQYCLGEVRTVKTSSLSPEQAETQFRERL